MFQTYEITSCDTSCDHSYMLLYCLRNKKNKKKQKEKSNQIKENMIPLSLILPSCIVVPSSKLANITITHISSEKLSNQHFS